VKYAHAKAQFVDWVRDDLKRAQAVLPVFVEQFGLDPVYTLDNCDHVFEKAAQVQVNKKVLNALTSANSKATLFTLYEFTLDEIRSVARRGTLSTSTTAQLMREMKGRVWAGMEETLRGFIGNIDEADARSVQEETERGRLEARLTPADVQRAGT